MTHSDESVTHWAERWCAAREARGVGSVRDDRCRLRCHVLPLIGEESMTTVAEARLEDVRDALTKVGVNGMTVTEVKGYGRQKGHTEIYRGAEYAVNFLPKLRIEIGVPADRANAVVETIATSAKTGQIGDGKIFVTEIDKAVRIRTGETDNDAL